MLPPSRLCIVLLCTLIPAAVNSVASAQRSDPRNAATWYQRGIDLLSNLTPADWEAIGSYDPIEGRPTPELRAALAKAGPILSAYEQGSRREYADFGLDHSQGLELLLPHLSQMRQMAQVLDAAAMVRLHDGDATGAARLLATAYRSVGHLGDDQTLISSLVGQAMFLLADGGVQRAVDRGALGPGESALLLCEVERLAGRGDAFNYTGAAVTEQEWVVGWLQAQRDDPEPPERLLQIFGGDDDEVQWVNNLMSMSEEEFGVAVAQYDHVMDRVVDIISIEDPELARAEVAKLDAEIMAGEHGPLMHMMPAWGRVLDRKIAADEALAKRLESLRALALGEAEPEELANAAVWYLRAIESLAQMEPGWLDELRQFSMEAELATDEDEQTPGRALEAALLLSQPILETLRDASLIRRCDFSIVHTGPTALAPTYASGMRDALRLIHADALRLIRAGIMQGAADRLAVGYRMIGHFSGDPHLVCSILAHRAFLEVHDLIEFLAQEGTLIGDERHEVLAAFERIDAGDPFGYLAARRGAAQRLRDHVRRHDILVERAEREAMERSPQLGQAMAVIEDVAPLPTNAEIVEKADESALLYYAALLQFFDRPAVEGLDDELAEQDERQQWAALHDVLDVDEVVATMQEAPQAFGERWRNRSRGALHGLEVRTLSALADRRQRARSDIRTTIGLLRRSAAGDAEPALDD